MPSNKIKEIIVYATGDSKELSTWSNVPYFFTNELEKRGIIVDRVDISFNRRESLKATIIDIYAKIKKLFIELFNNTKTIWKYNYTSFYEKTIENKIKAGLEKYKNADLQVVFHFSYAVKSNIPLVMIGDWTIDYRLQNKYNRKPLKIEEELIREQYKTMDNTDAIISILPESYNSLKQVFPNKSYYFGMHINALKPYVENNFKHDSNNIVFVGKKKYKEGLIKLINVINHCNDDLHKNFKIEIIGMNNNDINFIDKKYCTFYGYLNKSNKDECEKYYEIIGKARVAVNLTEKWNGISSLLEMLYYGLPLLISENKEVDKVIGENKEYCLYCKDDESIDSIANKLINIIELEEDKYKKLSNIAHNDMDKYTWDKFVDKFLEMAKDL